MSLTALGEQRGVLAGHRRQGLPGAQLRILLHGQLQGLPGIGHRAGRGGPGDVVRRLAEQARLGEAFHRCLAVAAAVARLGRRLAADRSGVLALRLRVDGLAQPGHAGMGVQAGHLLLGQGGVQRLGGALGAVQLGHRLGHVQCGRGALAAGAAGQQQALRGMHVAPALGGQFEALAAQRAAGGVAVLDQVAQFQPGVGQRGVQARAQLAGGVVQQPLLGAAAVVGLGVQAAERAGVAARASRPPPKGGASSPLYNWPVMRG